MYQIYKTSVHNEVGDFIPVVMSTISLQPSASIRAHPNFNREVLVEFIGAQVKTLSFMAYIIKMYQDLVVTHSNQLVTGMISLLGSCPMEVANLRRELLIATRHIMATDLRFSKSLQTLPSLARRKIKYKTRYYCIGRLAVALGPFL